MPEHLHFCVDGGWLVSAKHPIPDSRFAYKWTRQVLANGCNNLVCSACTARVLWRIDIEKPSLPPADAYAAWEAALSTDEPSTTWARIYACRCHVESQQGANPAPVTDENWGSTTPWRCAGHPVLGLPAVAFDVEITGQNWDEVVAQLALGRAQLHISEREITAPSCGTVMAALTGENRAAFGNALVRAVRHPDVQVRLQVLHSFALLDVWPEWPRELAKLVLAEPQWTEGVPDPNWPSQTLDWSAARAIAAIAPPDCAERADVDRAILVLRRLVLSPGGGQYLINALAALDRAWVTEHAAEIVAIDPDARSVVYGP